MSVGNLKDSGNQGNNFPWQLKMLLGQQCTCDELQAINANTDNLEFLLTSILTTLQEGTDYEAKFVTETCPGPPVTTRILLEVRVWDPTPAPGSWGPITYYLPGSTTPTTIGVGCTVTYSDPNTLLAQILNILTTRLDVNLSTRASATQLPATLGKKAMTDSLSVTLANDELGIARTTGIIRPTGPSAVGNVNTVPPSGRFFSVSVANVGSANGGLLGVANSIKPGEVLNFSADAVNNYFTSFAYDATGTEFIIIFVY